MDIFISGLLGMISIVYCFTQFRSLLMMISEDKKDEIAKLYELEQKVISIAFGTNPYDEEDSWRTIN